MYERPARPENLTLKLMYLSRGEFIQLITQNNNIGYKQRMKQSHDKI